MFQPQAQESTQPANDGMPLYLGSPTLDQVIPLWWEWIIYYFVHTDFSLRCYQMKIALGKGGFLRLQYKVKESMFFLLLKVS